MLSMQSPSSLLNGHILFKSSTERELTSDVSKADGGTEEDTGQPDGDRNGILRQAALDAMLQVPISDSQPGRGGEHIWMKAENGTHPSQGQYGRQPEARLCSVNEVPEERVDED